MKFIKKIKTIGIDFWQLLTPFWLSDEKGRAIIYFTLGIFLAIVSVEASIALNNVNKDFYNALEQFNKPALMMATIHFVVIVIVILLSFGYGSYLNQILSAHWRRWLTGYYVKKWLQNYNHDLSVKIDNPDQRISEDLASFPELTLDLFFKLFQAFLSFIAFSIILWSLSRNQSIKIGMFHFTIHGNFFWGALLYGIVGVWCITWIGKKLPKLDYQLQQVNADFRFSLIELRETNKKIPLEQEKLMHVFNPIFTNAIALAELKKRLLFFSSGYNTVAFVVGLFFATPLFLQHQIQLGELMLISGAFASVIGAFITIVSAYNNIALWRAVILRLTEFVQSFDCQKSVGYSITIPDKNSVNV